MRNQVKALWSSIWMAVSLTTIISAGPISQAPAELISQSVALRFSCEVAILNQLNTTLPVDGTWIVLDELMNVGDFYSPIYFYTSSTPIAIDVTDLFVASDQNEVYVDGSLVGAATPSMPDWTFYGSNPLGPPYTTIPEIAWQRPEFSKSSYALPIGTHMLTLRNIHIPPSPFQPSVPLADGTVAFRLVPEPSTATFGLLAAAMAGVFRRRAFAKSKD